MISKHKTLLDSVLAHVPHQGWTVRAITQAAKSVGMTQAQADAAFPRGIADVVADFHALLDDGMDRAIAMQRRFTSMRTRDKVAFAVTARLQAATPHREALRRLGVWALMPMNVTQASRLLWQAADKIWAAAGDTSTDYNFYTKRILLVAVMKATLLFWLNDESKNNQETWDFLDRRIGDVMNLGKGINLVKTGAIDPKAFVKSFLTPKSMF
jgi:ubiquinone biosynthesis protein COQ9